jgi:hypothetical protein
LRSSRLCGDNLPQSRRVRKELVEIKKKEP